MVFGLSERMEVILAVVSYSLCSGSLVLVNKLILSAVPFPSLVITLQLVSCVMFLYGAAMFDIIKVDAIKWMYLKPYLYYTIAFSTGVYCNMKSLSMSNVETVIVFRALAPLVVSLTEAAFLGRELPSMQSFTALSVIVLGAMGYASTDESFRTQGIAAYVWPFFYLFAISAEMVYGKKIVKDVKFETSSGPVQYTNLLGWPPCIIFASMSGEFKKLGETIVKEGGGTFYGYLASLSSGTVCLTILGCVVGTAIGYASWWCRDKVSATSFTLVGVMNKCLTILVNCLIWDNHATPAGIGYLLLCIVGGTFYRQAPMQKVVVAQDKTVDDEEEALMESDPDTEKSN